MCLLLDIGKLSFIVIFHRAWRSLNSHQYCVRESEGFIKLCQSGKWKVESNCVNFIFFLMSNRYSLSHKYSFLMRLLRCIKIFCFSSFVAFVHLKNLVVYIRFLDILEIVVWVVKLIFFFFFTNVIPQPYHVREITGKCQVLHPT